MTDKAKAAVVTATAACREFIKSGGTLEQWQQMYDTVVSSLSDIEVALSRLNSGELEAEIRRELERLTGIKLPPKR
jgi:hypothetical protein